MLKMYKVELSWSLPRSSRMIDRYGVNMSRNRLGPFFFFSFGCFSFSETDVPVLDGALLEALLGARLEDLGGAFEDLVKKPDGPFDLVSDSFFE